MARVALERAAAIDAANNHENLLIAVLGNGLADHLHVRDLAVLECTSPALKRSIHTSNLWRKLTVRETRPWYLELRKIPWYLELRKIPWYLESCNLIATAVAVKDVHEVYVDYEGITPEFLRDLCDVEQAAAGRPLRFTGRVARVEYHRFRYDANPRPGEFTRPHFDVASGTFCAGSAEREFSFIARHFPRATIVFEGTDKSPSELRKDHFELSPPALRGVITAIDNFLQRLSFTGDVCLGNYTDLVRYPWLESDEPDQDPWLEPEVERPPDLPERSRYSCSTGTCLLRDDCGSGRVDHPSGIHYDWDDDYNSEVYFKHEWITWSVGKLLAP